MLGGEFIFGHEDAVRLVAAAPHAAAQLVQLREAEPLGVLNHHHRGVGHVNAYLNDGGGKQDLRLIAGKPLHFIIFHFLLHLAVYNTDGVLGQSSMTNPDLSPES